MIQQYSTIVILAYDNKCQQRNYIVFLTYKANKRADRITKKLYQFKKNLNASKPSEHSPQVEECLCSMYASYETLLSCSMYASVIVNFPDRATTTSV